MKVVLLAPTPPPAGGIASWTVRMLQSQLKNGWQVAVVDEKAIGKRQVFGNKNKRNYFGEWKRCCRIWRNLRRELKDPEAKVVHSCIPSVPLAMLREYICAGITKRRGRKFVIHFRCTVPNTTQGKFAHFMLKKLCDKSDMIFSLNQQTSDFLAKRTKTPIRLIPNFISGDELLETVETRQEVKTVLYVGGVIESKGAKDMLQVAEKFPELQFRLVGKSEESVEKRAAKLPNVILTGPKNRDEVKQELQDADIFMFMTYFYGEGFSNSLVQAMAAGLPCIVTDWAANRDMIEDKGGAVVPVKSPDAAAEALRNMCSYDVRVTQSAFNIQKVQNCYIDKVVQDMYVDCYEELIG